MVTKENSPMHLLSFPTNPYSTVPNPGMSAECTINSLKTPTTKTYWGKAESTASLPLTLLLCIGVRGVAAYLCVVCTILCQTVIIPNRSDSLM